MRLRYCTIQFTDWGARTSFFLTGASVDATPHDTPHYHVIAHRCGYGDDLLAYCQEHEFAHAFVCEELMDEPSVVLNRLAHNRPVPRGAGLLEEMAAQQFQRWLRANERPIISGCNWDRMRAKAVHLLTLAEQGEEVVA